MRQYLKNFSLNNSGPYLAGRLSVNARRKAEGFDWGVVLPQWEALFEKVLLKKID